ncbi:hypothetical protein H311_02727 [Anncaliia algerae PRA109]|nr:hypothetical protein H311_02727 [Anncaliia algerae PRA109]
MLGEGSKKIKQLCNKLRIPLKSRLTAQIIYSRVYATHQHDNYFLILCCINLACKIAETPFDDKVIFSSDKPNYKEIKEVEKYISIRINHSFNIIPLHFIYLIFTKLICKTYNHSFLDLLDEMHEDERILSIKYFHYESRGFSAGDIVISLFKDEDAKHIAEVLGLSLNYSGLDEIRETILN